MADDNELLFQMRMQDQISGVMQGIEGSFKDVASVVQQQMAAMQQLTAALQAQAGGARAATSAAQAHAAGMKAVGDAMKSAASDTNAAAAATKASASAHGAHAEATKKSGEAAREAAEQNKSLAGRLGEVTSTAKEAVEALVGLYASNEMAKASIEASEELEHTIRDIGAAAGASRDQVTELLEALNKKAGSGFAYAEQLEGLAKIGATLTSSTEQIETFATAIGKISNGSNFQQLGNSIAQLLAQTNEGAEKVQPLADALGKLGLSARGGVEGLTEISNMIARFTAGMDMSSTKIVGYAATFAKMFQPEQARMASAQFGMMLQTISKQAREGGDGLADLAGRLGTTYEAMRKLGQEHPDEVFQKILQVTNAIKSSGGNPADFLKQFGLGDGRQLQQIEALSDHFRDLQKNIADAQDATGGGDAFNAEKLTPYDQAVRQLSNSWKELKEEFGADFTGTAVQAFKILTGAIQEVTGIIHSMPEGLREAVAAFVILVPAIGGVTLGVGAFVRAFRELKDGLVSAGVALSEVGAAMNGASSAAAEASVKMEGAAAGVVTAEEEVAVAAKSMEEAVAFSWRNMALSVGTYLVAVDAAHEAGVGIANLIKQQQEFGKQGITWKDEGLGLGAMLPNALGGGYFKDKLTESFRAKREAGGEHGGGEHHEGEGERKEGGGERGNGEHETPKPKSETPNPTTPQSATTPFQARNSLQDFSPAIKAAKDYADAVEHLQTAIEKMDGATKAALASEIAGAQQALQLRQAELDPLNKMTDAWHQSMQAAQAYTKTQQEAAAIEKQVFDARQEAYKRGEGDAGADRAEKFVRTTQPQVNRATSDTAYAKEAEGMYRTLAASSAITQSEKDRLAVEQQIAKWQSDTTYTQAQITQLTKILELTKEWEREVGQISQLNPQATAISKYNDDLKELNSRLASGKVNQQEYNREKMALDQQSKAQRDPLGNIADQNNEELKEAQVVGKYRDADVKTLQQINQLKQQGITLDAQQAQSLQGSNRALADVKEAQQQLDSLSQAFGSSLQSAVTGALNGNRGAFREALASLGGQLFKMGTDQIFKQLTPSVAQVLPGITGAAQNANNALAKAGASQMASTMASANQEIAQAQINIANATMAAGLTNQGAAANGAPTALPGATGTGQPGATGVPNPSGLAQVVAPGTAAAAAVAGGAQTVMTGGAPTVPAVTGTGITNVPTAVAGGAATAAGAAGAGAVASGLPSAVAGGAFGTGVAPQLPGNGIGSINPSQFSQAFPMPSFATTSIKAAGPPVSEADTARWNKVFGRDPSPGEAVNIQKRGVEKALDVTNNPSMKAQDSQWALGNKDWKSVDPNMTNRDYVKSLTPPDQTTTTMTTPNPSFPQNGVGTIGDPSALMKLPEQIFGAAKGGAAAGANPFGDLGAAQKAFGNGQTSVFGAQAQGGAGYGPIGSNMPAPNQYNPAWNNMPAPSQVNLDAGGMPAANALTEHMMSTYGLTREQAVGAVGTMGYESGNFKQLQEMGHSGTGSGYGYAQWTGPRRTAFMENAQQNGLDPKSYDAQVSMIDKELSQAPYKRTIADLKNTDNVGDASKVWQHDYEGMNVTGKGKIEGVPAVQEHIDRAQQYYNQGVGMPRNQGIDTTPTGSISSAAKQAQDAAQQQMTAASEQFTKMQTQVQTGLKDSTQAFQTNFGGLGSSISKTSETALGGVGDMGSFGQSISGMLEKLQSGGGGGGMGGLGGLFGGGGGGGGFGDFADFSAFHSGGKVGSNTGFLTRRVSSALFLGAPKFHDGLNSDEFPAVLQRGERVLTNAQEQKTTSIVDKLADAVNNKSTPGSQRATPAAQRAAGSRVNMVVNVKDANSFRLSQSQIMAQAHSAMMRTSAKHN